MALSNSELAQGAPSLDARASEARGTLARLKDDRVWVVEDSALEARRVLALLSGAYSVELFTDAGGVLERLSQGEALPRLVLLDWHMPGISGLETCRFLRERYDEVTLPILVVTASTQREDLEEALGAGANDFVPKPYNDVELLARVRTLVRVRAQAEGLREREEALRLREAEAQRALADARAARTLAESALADVQAVTKALRQSEERYRRLSEAGIIGILEWEASGVITQANDTLLRALGYSREDLEAGLLDFRRLTPPEHQEATERAMRTLQATGVLLPFEKQYFRKDGSRMDILLASATLDEARQRGIGLVLDITERKALEAAQRESEERLRRVVKASGTATWELDLATQAVTRDARHLELLGLPPDTELTLPAILEAIHPEDREGATRAIAAALAGQDAGRYLVELRTRGAPGTSGRWLEGRGQVHFDAEGKAVRLVGTSLDITARKAAEAEREELLARAEAERRKLYDTFVQAPFPIVILEGPRHTFTFVNDAYAQLLQGRQVVGMPVVEALPGIASQGLVERLDEVVATGVPYFGREVPVHHPHHAPGEVDYLNFVYQPMRGPEGRVEGVLVSAFEVTEEVLARQTLERHAADLQVRADFEEKLIGIVGHDLRQPLQAIAMSASLLLRRQGLDERAVTGINRITSAAARMQRMLGDILDFTRARLGGGILLRRAEGDLARVAREAIEEVELAHPGRQVELRLEGSGQGLWDADRLRQVLDNLLANAMAYSPAETPVRLAVDGREAGEVGVRVHNGGTPIPPELLPVIFQPMTRGAGPGGEGRSVGLGLFIVRHLVEAHGGRVEVASSEAEGTTFTLRLPRG